jgi:hypothetical protein
LHLLHLEELLLEFRIGIDFVFDLGFRLCF